MSMGEKVTVGPVHLTDRVNRFGVKNNVLYNSTVVQKQHCICI